VEVTVHKGLYPPALGWCGIIWAYDGPSMFAYCSRVCHLICFICGSELEASGHSPITKFSAQRSVALNFRFDDLLGPEPTLAAFLVPRAVDFAPSRTTTR
jgi:hypothetical protein